MQKISFVFAFVFILVTNFAFGQSLYKNQARDYSVIDLYEKKVAKYTAMKKRGWTIAAVGTGLTILGPILASNSEWDSSVNSYGQPQSSPKDVVGTIGIICVVAGIPSMIGGTILGTVGSRKLKVNLRKLERLKVNLNQLDNQSNISLVYRF